MDVGRLPEELSELRRSEATNWDGPYLPKDIPLDPWGTEYNYSVTSDNLKPFVLKSFGADGAEGGEGDDEDIILQ